MREHVGGKISILKSTMELALAAAFGLLLTSVSAAAVASEMPHFEAEMSTADYIKALHAQKNSQKLASDQLDYILDLGRRNYDWIIHINSLRKGKPPISLSSAATQLAFPIEAPRIFNPGIILSRFRDLMSRLPIEMRRVLVDRAPYTDTPPVDEQTFVEFGLHVDRVYQLAARWRLLSPYLDALAARKKEDIRGYYFLERTTDLKNKLENFASLPDGEQAQISGWLVSLCSMFEEPVVCSKSIAEARGNRQVLSFYQRYQPQGEQAWNAYFAIGNSRSDVVWNVSQPDVMTVPFSRPDTDDVIQFLQSNVEDEWHWKNWKLKLNFLKTDDPYTTHIRFEPGVTPHVNGLAGSLIVMDANAPLSEYNAQWTIRHEYGHTLGFPDCYLEFYDKELEQMVSYQLDITNLMCSRRGHFNDLHYNELKRVYYSGESQR
jgi:hypothetical protein